MKTTMRWWRKAALTACALLAGVAAQAANISTDTLTVTIRPNAGYIVEISTWLGGADLGAVDLAASTRTVAPSTVTVKSSYAYTGLKLQGSIQSAGTPWTFAANTAAQGLDQLAAWAVFTDTGVGSYAAVGSTGTGATHFLGTAPGANSGVVDATSRVVGGTGNTCPGTETVTTPQFITTSGQAGFKKMGCLKPMSVDTGSARSHLWLYFVLPPATSATNAQNVSFTLYAAAPN